MQLFLRRGLRKPLARVLLFAFHNAGDGLYAFPGSALEGGVLLLGRFGLLFQGDELLHGDSFFLFALAAPRRRSSVRMPKIIATQDQNISNGMLSLCIIRLRGVYTAPMYSRTKGTQGESSASRAPMLRSKVLKRSRIMITDS